MSNLIEKNFAMLRDRKQSYVYNSKRKIKTSKQFIWAIIFAISLFLGGCGMLNMFTESYEDIRDEMLQHLYEKYGIEFTGVSLERGHHDHLIAYPTGGDRDNDFVSMQRHVRDGEVEFRDTFFGVIMRDDLEAGVAAALADIDLPFQVFFSTGLGAVYDNKFDGTKTFADFNAWVAEGNPGRLSINVTFGIESVESTECLDAYADRAFEKIQETGYSLGVVLTFAPIEIFEQIDRSNRADITGKYRNELVSIVNDRIN